jgi:predicted DCC family thiol-disulfide oxidoreductase YuxK
MNTPPQLTLFYDGLCPLCSREIVHYRKRLAGTGARFVDITDPAFDAPSHGLDPGRVHRLMHVKVGDEVRTGLEAFLAVWEAIPAYRRLARLARVPGIHAALDLGYRLFARVRPWLPRSARPCATGACRR